MYDMGWLESDGIDVKGSIFDTMVAEALIDNTRESYALEVVAQDYLAEMKDDAELIVALNAMGITPTKKKPVQDYLWMLPHETVASYAIQDAKVPLKAHYKQHRIMETMGVDKLFYDVEMKLLRCLLEMRKIGCPYSVEQSHASSIEAKDILDRSNKMMLSNYGNINPNSAREIAYWFDKLDIAYPMTAKGNPSIKREYLEHLIESEGLEKLSVHDYLPLLILNARRLGKSEKDYIESIRDNFLCSDGRIRCSFHQTRGEEYGTVSGRFSCSHPNLQQITSAERDSFIGGLCRRAFVPFDGCDWLKIDMSQIEYRLMAHYAKGPGSKEIRAAYNNDPNTDYHSYIVDLTGLIRPIAKNLNFGIAYGMGVKKMMAIYGWSEYKCYEILDTYHGNAPFIKYTMGDVERVAKQRGRIKTILGRQSQLNDANKAYVMFNRLIQGSAADQMKKTMVDLFDSGLMQYMYPHLTVHDEMDFSIPKGSKQMEHIRAAVEIMENSVKLRVPVIAEASIGPNWGDVEKTKVAA